MMYITFVNAIYNVFNDLEMKLLIIANHLSKTLHFQEVRDELKV
ncbi:Mediator of RNA polymerase II transcription subunit 28 [Labeo rohita]|uniref:Mediator of RNA polymerase II transcription subunit 28 n=1 Tax=Labeo rohita TaxID=84645 RepID=A0ABQ8M8P1_LABRO|nr:Mediator of RNA polymerase II transcription subunit 28 [Labeo rohita]